MCVCVCARVCACVYTCSLSLYYTIELVDKILRVSHQGEVIYILTTFTAVVTTGPVVVVAKDLTVEVAAFLLVGAVPRLALVSYDDHMLCLISKEKDNKLSSWSVTCQEPLAPVVC